jgi:hypothetical protein
MGRKKAMAFGAVLVALACDGSDPALETAPSIWCEAVCSRVQSCGYVVPACESDCVRQRQGLANLSRSGAEALAPCLQHLSCSAIAGDEALWESEMDACWREAQSTLRPTERVRRFCEPYTAALFHCGYVLPVDDCESIYGMWSDAMLQRVSDCDQSSCVQLEACVEAVFDAP